MEVFKPLNLQRFFSQKKRCVMIEKRMKQKLLLNWRHLKWALLNSCKTIHRRAREGVCIFTSFKKLINNLRIFKDIFENFHFYSKLEKVRIGYCKNKKLSETECVRIRNCQNWKLSKLEIVKIENCQKMGICENWQLSHLWPKMLQFRLDLKFHQKLWKNNYAQLLIWHVLKFWQLPILTISNSDSFQYWQFPVLAISNSDNLFPILTIYFQFWQFLIAATSNSENFQFWQFSISSKRRKKWILTNSNTDKFHSPKICPCGCLISLWERCHSFSKKWLAKSD